jgi:flavin reductase (DIM6/NTAB) family NADH-FMN oxidoreductase RutF
MQNELMRALASLATGIYVMTVRDGERRHGMSSSWVTQVSGNPPLLVAAVDRRHFTHDVLSRTGRFVLNIVGRSSRALEDYFYSPAARRADNLDAVAWEDSPRGQPLLRDALASLECRNEHVYPAGDHSLFVAAIEHVTWRGPDRPLTSLDLEYVYIGEVVKRTADQP